jgi:hypothetical protein
MHWGRDSGLGGFVGHVGVEEGGGKGAAGRAGLGFELGFGPLPDRSLKFLFFFKSFKICKLIWIQFKFKFWWLLLAKIKYKNISPTKENYASAWNATIKYLFKYINYRILFFLEK